MALQVPQAKANLLAAIRLLPALAGVSVDGYPRTDQNDADQMVYIDAIEFSQVSRGLNSRPEESFTLPVKVHVVLSTGPDATEARCWEIIQAIAALAGDKAAAFGSSVHAQDEIISGVVNTGPASLDGKWISVAELRVPGRFFN